MSPTWILLFFVPAFGLAMIALLRRLRATRPVAPQLGSDALARLSPLTVQWLQDGQASSAGVAGGILALVQQDSLRISHEEGATRVARGPVAVTRGPAQILTDALAPREGTRTLAEGAARVVNRYRTLRDEVYAEAGADDRSPSARWLAGLDRRRRALSTALLATGIAPVAAALLHFLHRSDVAYAVLLIAAAPLIAAVWASLGVLGPTISRTRYHDLVVFMALTGGLLMALLWDQMSAELGWGMIAAGVALLVASRPETPTEVLDPEVGEDLVAAVRSSPERWPAMAVALRVVSESPNAELVTSVAEQTWTPAYGFPDDSGGPRVDYQAIHNVDDLFAVRRSDEIRLLTVLVHAVRGRRY